MHPPAASSLPHNIHALSLEKLAGDFNSRRARSQPWTLRFWNGRPGGLYAPAARKANWSSRGVQVPPRLWPVRTRFGFLMGLVSGDFITAMWSRRGAGVARDVVASWCTFSVPYRSARPDGKRRTGERAIEKYTLNGPLMRPAPMLILGLKPDTGLQSLKQGPLFSFSRPDVNADKSARHPPQRRQPRAPHLIYSRTWIAISHCIGFTCSSSSTLSTLPSSSLRPSGRVALTARPLLAFKAARAS